jgi:hypothetical protein
MQMVPNDQAQQQHWAVKGDNKLVGVIETRRWHQYWASAED